MRQALRLNTTALMVVILVLVSQSHAGTISFEQQQTLIPAESAHGTFLSATSTDRLHGSATAPAALSAELSVNEGGYGFDSADLILDDSDSHGSISATSRVGLSPISLMLASETVAVTPEPGSIVLACLGAFGVLAAARHRRKKTA